MSIVKMISNGFGVLLFAGVMAFAFSGTVKGWVFTMMWDGASTLDCGGDWTMTIRDRTITAGDGPVFMAGGDCRLNIVNSTIRAGVVVMAGGSATVVIDGGTIEGTKAALDLGGTATVEIKNGAKIIGPIKRGGKGHVSGLPADDPRVAGQVDPGKREAVDRVTEVVCADLLDCYKKHAAFGQIDVQVAAELGDDGKIGAVEVARGTPPEAVAGCLVETVKGRTPPAAGLGAGQVVCEFSGTFTEGAQMLATGARFVPAKKK